MMCNKFLYTLGVAAILNIAQTQAATAFNFSSIPDTDPITPGLQGSSINFSGGGFSFNPAAGPNFAIDNGTAAGFQGTLGGSFTIGGGAVTAPVLGLGSFSIDDGATDLTADMVWLSITQIGVGGSLNTSGLINVANFSYAGSNPDLLAIASVPSGKLTLGFSFNNPLSLDDLRTGTFSTSFAGTFANDGSRPPEGNLPDGGATAALLGISAIGLGLARRARC